MIEEQEKLGGQMNLAAIPPGKYEFREAIENFAMKAKKAGVELILGKRADNLLLQSLHPDKVILATGARPITPKIEGIENISSIQAWEVLEKGSVAGQKIAIIGGGAVGIETAEFLASLGKEVTVIEILPFWGKGIGPICRTYVKNKMARKEINFEILISTKVIGVEHSKLVLECRGTRVDLEGIDSIVFAIGAHAENSLHESVSKNHQVPIFVIGDAKQPRNALIAIWEGVDTGLKV